MFKFSIFRKVSLAILMITLNICTLVPVSIAETTAKLSDGDNLVLLGIGVHQELRHDIYIGALFASSMISDVDQLKNDNISKRMSLRFVSNYSNRKLAQHWKSRLAINNPREEWQPLTKEIVSFSNIFKRSFEVGDELNIDHIPGVGTQIFLNSTLFLTIKKPGFVDLLLNVWIGNIPPTKAFKTSIRGLDEPNVKAGYIANYESLTALKGRFDSDLITKVAQVETKPEAEKPKPAKEENTTTTIPVKKAVETQAKKLADAATIPPVKIDTPPAKPIADSSPKPKPVVKKVAVIEKPVVKEIEELFDADLITGSYIRDLINSIKEFQEYPRKALIEKEEGDVLAKVTISTTGEIIDIELLERSGSRSLDKAVSKIIKKAAPFQPIPKELNLTQFDFEVPISFQL